MLEDEELALVTPMETRHEKKRIQGLRTRTYLGNDLAEGTQKKPSSWSRFASGSKQQQVPNMLLNELSLQLRVREGTDNGR